MFFHTLDSKHKKGPDALERRRKTRKTAAQRGLRCGKKRPKPRPGVLPVPTEREQATSSLQNVSISLEITRFLKMYKIEAQAKKTDDVESKGAPSRAATSYM